MLQALRRMRSALLCWLAKRDVVSSDQAEATGDPMRARRLLDRADDRLKRGCGCSWPKA